MNEPKCPYCGEEMKHTEPRLFVKRSGVGVMLKCFYYCESCGSRAPVVNLDCETESEIIQAARAAALRIYDNPELLKKGENNG